MQDTAIELLIVGNNPTESEGYLTSLRNSGIAVHAHQTTHDSKALSTALKNPVDIILYTKDSDALGIPEILRISGEHELTIPIIALADNYDNGVKLDLMSQGACDLVQRKENRLLVQVVEREFQHIKVARRLNALGHQLKEAEERCNLLTESSREAIAYIHQGMHVKANGAYLKLFGLAHEEEIEGLPILDMVAPSAHQRFKKLLRKLGTATDVEAQIESPCLHADGTEFNAELSFQPAVIEGEPCTQIIIRNQSPGKDIEEKLRLLSTQDTQTGLCNRQYFLNELDQLCDAIKDRQTDHVLFYITLDNFKRIRDGGGMLVGDHVVSEMASVLKRLTSSGDLLARFGDHTFTLLTVLEQRDEIKALAEKICRLAKEHDYQEPKLMLNPTCSIGAVRASPQLGNAHDFINQAYQAWDRASSEGDDQIEVVDAVEDKALSLKGSEADLDSLIEHALKQDQFRLVYQPIVSLHGDTRENYAVLVRLLDHNQEEIHPDHFLAQAEAIGKMPELDRWIIRRAISELTQHRQQGNKVNFFINISGASLGDDLLLLWICDCLREFEARGSWLVFQIKEQDARSRVNELSKLMEGLKKIKCKISIDHFGLVPKPEAILQHLPVDFVQFDQRLVEGLAGDQDKQDRLNDLNHQMQKMKIKTVAAGVDETNSLTILWSIGVDYIRGYFIQEPSPNINYDFKM